MKLQCFAVCAVWYAVCVCTVEGSRVVVLSEQAMCEAKVTCERCLRLPQCAWCRARAAGPHCFPVELRAAVACEGILTYEDHGFHPLDECLRSENRGLHHTQALALRMHCICQSETSVHASVQHNCGNAKCVCAHGDLPRDCVPPGAPADVKCSGRGACVCGRCLCREMDEPNKIVSGRYCECDNFSCEGVVGADCTEGPYCHDYNTTAATDPPAP